MVVYSLGMGLGLAQPKAQLIWAGPGRPKSALGRKILAQTHLQRDGFGFGPAQGPMNLGWAGPKNIGPNPSLILFKTRNFSTHPCCKGCRVTKLDTWWLEPFRPYHRHSSRCGKTAAAAPIFWNCRNCKKFTFNPKKNLTSKISHIEILNF